MLVAWVLFPLVLLLVCTGCGLLVERAAGWRLSGALTPSLGLALVIVVATLTTYKAATAPLTTAIVVVLALAGFALSLTRVRGWRVEPWALIVGLGAFAAFAAPVVLSGNATFLGYFVLNDTAVHFALIDHLLSHGRELTGVPPSALQATLDAYVGTNYPIGAHVALGAVRPLVGQDVAWIFQPYLAVILSLGAVCLYELLGGIVGSRPLRALCAFVAAQSGLLYAYYLEASIKELATTWVITLTVVLVVATLAGRVGLRRLIPLALVAVAGFDVLQLAVAPWIAIPLAVFAVVAGWRARHALRAMPRQRLAFGSAGFALALVAIALPVIVSARKFFDVAHAVLTQQADLGNLVGPLVKWQMLGIWPSGDFRFAVSAHYRITYALLGVAAVSGAFGVAWAIRRRLLAPLLLLASGSIAAWYLLGSASPYASAKVMAIFSLTVVLTVMLGAAALHDTGRRIEAWALGLLLAGGVLWTNAVAYRGASVAPRARLAELSQIGQRFSGQGPAFYNLSDEFAVHFLGAEAPADPGLGPPAVRPGTPPRDYRTVRAPWDPDELDESYLQSFKLLVIGRSPHTSRPPADFGLVYRGRYYDVWRHLAGPQVLAHKPLSEGLDPAAPVPCKALLPFAGRARQAHARLAYAAREAAPTLVPTQTAHPPNWGEVDGDPNSLIPRQESGAVVGTVTVEQPGRYRAWLQGAFSRRVELWVDGRQVASQSFELGTPEQDVSFGTLTLRAGTHSISIYAPPDGLSPGVALVNQTIGPLTFARLPERDGVAEAAPSAARQLCGRRLDWVEIVR
jgi:hypothetical protein